MSETDLAAQLATRLEVVQALEQGAIYALPPWPETCRVVSTYGTLLNLDVRPLLRRIYSQIEAGIVELAPKPMPDVPFMTPPQDGLRDTQPWPGQGQGQGGPRAADPFPAAPRQSPPQPRQPMPDRPWPQQPGGQAPAPQFRPQPQAHPQDAPSRGVPQPQQQPQLQPQPQGLRVQPPQRAETLALTHARAPQPATPQPAPPPQAAPQAKPAKKAAPAAPAAKKGRGGLLKWGIALLLASAVAFGLWVWLAQPSLFGLLGSGATSSGDTAPVTDDPADPRSRKGDRLPSPASQ